MQRKLNFLQTGFLNITSSFAIAIGWVTHFLFPTYDYNYHPWDLDFIFSIGIENYRGILIAVVTLFFAVGFASYFLAMKAKIAKINSPLRVGWISYILLNDVFFVVFLVMPHIMHWICGISRVGDDFLYSIVAGIGVGAVVGELASILHAEKRTKVKIYYIFKNWQPYLTKYKEGSFQAIENEELKL